jgi:hypothetical protein
LRYRSRVCWLCGIAQVHANAGKKIDAPLADRMIGWARDLISRI